MSNQEELSVQILIGEYQEALSAQMYENVKLKTLLKQAKETEKLLLEQLERNREQVPVYEGEIVQE